MKHLLIITLLSLVCSLNLTGQVVFPTPQKVQKTGGKMIIKEKVSLYAEKTAGFYLDLFQEEVIAPYEATWSQTPEDAQIVWITDASLPEEGYTIEIKSRQMKISAATDKGFLYAVQTLRQWKEQKGQNLAFNCARISDAPQHPWRGFMLDSGRQYQRIETLKKYIDMCSMLKMNYFHWHLTEGFGWRLEIKQYPLLTSVGSQVAKGPEQQGFYTQEEVRELVAYAAERNIVIVPEIDMPGHAEAALYAYPGMGCFGVPIEIPDPQKTQFTHQIFCAGKESVLLFLRNVLDEVCELFPSTFIHLGGDEAPKNNWEACPDCQKRIKDLGLKDCQDLQMWFSAQMAQHLKNKGKKAVFWGDVVYKDGGYQLPDNVVIQWWNYIKHSDVAVRNSLKQGYPIICSPNHFTYLNYPVEPWKKYAKPRTFDIKDAYENNPAVKVLEENHKEVMGMSCALWTDHGVTEDLINIRLFPRILVLADQMWYQGKRLPFKKFYRNIQQREPWFEAEGFEYGPALRKENQVK